MNIAIRLSCKVPRYGARNFLTGKAIFSDFKKNSNPSSTIIEEEVSKFNSDPEGFWSGKFCGLVAMNAVRVPLVRDGILSAAGKTVKSPLPLSGYKIVDVGCGAGVLSEPLARLGASVTGLDPGPDNVAFASNRASRDAEIRDRLSYVCDTVENFSVSSKGQFDALVCSEVVEHVSNVPHFVQMCVELVKDGGSLFFTTINKTAMSYIVVKVLLEYVVKRLPVGTHEWNMFVPPEDLQRMLESCGCRVVSINGTVGNPFTNSWRFSNSSAITYALHAIK